MLPTMAMKADKIFSSSPLGAFKLKIRLAARPGCSYSYFRMLLTSFFGFLDMVSQASAVIF